MRKILSPIVIAFAALLAATQACANAGRVDFAVGNVTAQQPAVQPRPLVKGADVLSGDKIVVGDGRAQVRFNDGAYVSLLPNTEFHIREFRYSGKTDGSERSFMSLLRGTVRAVSGLVGRVNKAAYQIETPTATLGIRGTAGIIEVAADGTTKITTTSGIWTMNNKAGSVDVPAGQAAVST
ncbi:MAG: FecR family protein, partial [Burkholderiales bacterium]